MVETTGSGVPASEVVERLRAAGCVFAEDEARLLLEAAAEEPATDDLTPRPTLEEMLTRRVAGEPLETVLGWAGFCGLRIAVVPGVFVPRQRSQVLVAETLRGLPRRAVVLDLCCGSGAIGVAVAAHHGLVELHAVDADPAAVRCATGNAEAVGGRVYLGDLFEPLPPRLRVDAIVASPPYVPTAALATMPPEARDHEPRATLDGGADGLDLARRIVAGAVGWLAPGGRLLVEVSAEQAPLLEQEFTAHGFTSRTARDGEVDGTAVVGTRP